MCKASLNQQKHHMTGEEFITWRKSLHLTRIEAAAQLGMSRNSVTAYENDASKIPNYIALACAALAKGIEPWGQNKS